MTHLEAMTREFTGLRDLFKAKRASMNEERLRADGWWYKKTAQGWKKSRKDGAQAGGRITDPRRMLPDRMADVDPYYARMWTDAERKVNRQESRRVGQRQRRAKAPAPESAMPGPEEWSSPYFKSAAAEAIFKLTQLDGEQRVQHLGIGLRHYSKPEVARAWRDQLAKLVHPDRSEHPGAAAAMAKLQEMYHNMVGHHGRPSPSRRKKKGDAAPAERPVGRTAAEHREAAQRFASEAESLQSELDAMPHDHPERDRVADRLDFIQRMRATQEQKAEEKSRRPAG